MGRITVIAAAAATTLVVASHTADAQDLSANNIYLRLDTGYSWSRSGDQTIGNGDLGDTVILGGGVGYRWGHHIRTDLTLTYRGWYQIKSTINSSFVFPSSSGGLLQYSGPNDARAFIQNFSTMFNAYYDIGHFGPVMPYVGGGVGFVYNNMESVTYNVGGDVGSVSGDARTDLAWQLSIGVAVDVANNTSIDIGYRYMNMGQVISSQQANLVGVPQVVDRVRTDLAAHELQVGLRYSF